MVLREIISFHFVIAVFFTILGYISYSLLVENNIMEINLLINDYQNVMSEKEKAGFMMIFINNITFFSLVCVLPILNFIYLSVQFFNIGTYIYQIKSLAFLQQFTLLYRHSIFEILALMIAIYISYSLIQMSNTYLKSTDIDFPYRKRFKQLAFAYVVILVLTFVGALLEGNVHVLI
ncbi:stage II sporulation protein M [Metabacillus malikii]|uniref:Stage II sporulation protein M n=1 Tax=Metabacillus malikii TaxID=1504265 RepID=A0ABT9ZH97_9BACI|nr:stage II sporulation protein M [Metabacillus malikii]MDQ0231655.1 hypothetical protein [Metabacillus malikii]